MNKAVMNKQGSKPVAIVLGGTRPHVELINKLKRRGFFTVLIDYYENPPARSVADRHIRESTLDQDAVLTISRDISAHLVISTCIDQANVTAAYVGEKLDLSIPYSYATALTMSRKSLMKEIMTSHDIPTSPFVIIKHEDDLDNIEMSYPLVVKPVDSNGSKGVRRVDNNEQLRSSFREALRISRCGEVIVEGFCEGANISVDCFVKDGIANVLMLRRKYDLPATSETVINCYASLAPAQITQIARKNIEAIASKVTRAFGLQTTALLIQVIVNGDEVNVIELAPRIGGGMSYRSIPMGTGFDILGASISSYLNEDHAISLEPRNTVILSTNVYAKQAVFGSLHGHQSLLDLGVIDEFFQHKTCGMKIGPSLSSGDRPCSFIICADSLEEALIRNQQAMENLDILDEDGNSIMRKDIFLRGDNV